MGPAEDRPQLTAVGGVDGAVDQVIRLREFRKAHPQAMITSPRQNGTLLWRATWIEDTVQPDDEGAVAEVTSYDLRILLDRLDARFGR
jgi:hypothetical protein